MNRRAVLSIGVAGAATAVFVPPTVLAAGPTSLVSPLAGSVYYTVDAPGRWAGKEGGHIPMIERNGATIQVTTGHEMDDYHHYIVKHVILNKDFEFVGETMFDPEKDAPISEHYIGGQGSTIYALSVCNKHDAWLNVLEI